METYGIHAAENKKEALNEMLLALDKMNRQGSQLVHYLSVDLRAYDTKVKSGSNLYQEFRSQHFSEIHSLMGPINVEWNKMVNSRNELLSDGKHARTLFVVKEN